MFLEGRCANTWVTQKKYSPKDTHGTSEKSGLFRITRSFQGGPTSVKEALSNCVPAQGSHPVQFKTVSLVLVFERTEWRQSVQSIPFVQAISQVAKIYPTESEWSWWDGSKEVFTGVLHGRYMTWSQPLLFPADLPVSLQGMTNHDQSHGGWQTQQSAKLNVITTIWRSCTRVFSLWGRLQGWFWKKMNINVFPFSKPPGV